MSSYATYCQDQAADCARRARLARSPEIAAYCRSLGLRWMRLAEQAQETDAPGWTHDATLGQATPRRFVTKAGPSDVELLAKVYSSLEAWTPSRLDVAPAELRAEPTAMGSEQVTKPKAGLATLV
jgi:hypothetical protein